MACVCCVYCFLKKWHCDPDLMLCIEMRLLVRSALVFAPVCRGLAYERHGVGRVAFFSSMDGLSYKKKTHTSIDPPTAARACEQQNMSPSCRSARRRPPRSPRFARLARRPALDMQVGNRSATYSLQRMWTVTILHVMCNF